MKFRAFAKMPTVVALAGAGVAGFMRLVKGTSSAACFPRNFHSEIAADQPFILAMWHGQFMMLAGLNQPGFKVSPIVLRHSDGELVAAPLEHYDIDLIRGGGAGSTNMSKARMALRKPGP
jgi:3-deoxy-D-manno-octulosonic-acid transferase